MLNGGPHYRISCDIIVVLFIDDNMCKKISMLDDIDVFLSIFIEHRCFRFDVFLTSLTVARCLGVDALLVRICKVHETDRALQRSKGLVEIAVSLPTWTPSYVYFVFFSI